MPCRLIGYLSKARMLICGLILARSANGAAAKGATSRALRSLPHPIGGGRKVGLSLINHSIGMVTLFVIFPCALSADTWWRLRPRLAINFYKKWFGATTLTSWAGCCLQKNAL